jgi:Kef-type K+ transport system membrane component KefB
VILLIVIILVAAAITGSLGGVLEVAAGVAIGLFLFVIGIGLLGYWFAKRRWGKFTRGSDDRWGHYPERRDYRGYRDYRDV